MAIRRPSGILPAGKVFQVPPPVVDANVPTSEAAGCAGCVRTGVWTGWASAISGSDWVGCAFGGTGVRAGGGGGEFCATAEGAGAGDVDFPATTNGVADAEGFGVGLFFANLPFGVGVAFIDLFLPCTWTIGGGVIAFAGSTLTS